MKFQINYKRDNKQANYRANQWMDFESEAWDIFRWVLDHPDQESDYEFVVEGKVVNMDLAQKAATHARKEWEAKRATTHKQISVSQGATCLSNTFRKVWVKK